MKKKKFKYNTYIKSIRWSNKRDKALERDNYSCRKCWCNNNLHVHHASYRRLWTEKVSDLFTLCSHCHKEFHSIYWTSRDMISITKQFIWYIKKPKKQYEITPELIKYIKDWWKWKSQNLVPLKIWNKTKRLIKKGLLL